MNRKQLILIFLALAVLGGASLLLLRRDTQSWSAQPGKMGRKLFPNFPINDVAAMNIQAGADLRLARKDGIWRVRERGDYPANFSQISELVQKLAALKISQSEPIGPSQLAHMELLPPGKGMGSGTLVTFADDKGKTIQSLLLGKKHLEEARGSSQFAGAEFPNGRYVMLPADPASLLLVSDPLDNLAADPVSWLDHDFFKIEKPASIAIVSADATNSWKLTRESETAPWVLADTNAGEILDSNKVVSLSSAFSYASFVDVATNTDAAKTGLDKPFGVNISTFDHFAYAIKVGNKTPEDNYYLTVAVSAEFPTNRVPGKDEKPEDKAKLDKDFETQTKTLQEKLASEKSLDKWIYLVNNSQLEPLMRQRAELMVEKKVDKPDANSTNSVPPLPQPVAPPPPDMPNLQPPAPPK
ncbi:MAG: DUF4340 domain-containing protein [Verrucomicrobiota bacterium]|jgi:hypothetical protein